MIKRLIIVLLLALAAPAWAAPTTSPQQVVKDNAKQMLKALGENRQELDQNPNLIYGLVSDILLPHFDFETMSRWVLGKYWRQADAAQREQFVKEFRTLLVNTYSSALLEYSNEEFRILPSPDNPGAEEATVRSEIVPRSGPSVPINYSMHVKNNAWKVYDVSIEGVSLVTNYRGTFASQIRKEGIGAMIQKLTERNARGPR